MAEGALSGCGVVVTRQMSGSSELCDALEAAGALALNFPTIEILRVYPAPQVGAEHDWIIYTSAEAVAQDAALRTRCGRIAAIGPATAAALAREGVTAALVAPGDGSESLLAALGPQLAVAARVLLVTGRDGRTLLRDSLRTRGVELEEAAVYERTLPASDPRILEDLWRQGGLHAVICSSNAALANLMRLLGTGPRGLALLDAVQLVVASERAVRLARELGIVRAPLVANDASAPALVAALARWWPTAAPNSPPRMN